MLLMRIDISIGPYSFLVYMTRPSTLERVSGPLNVGYVWGYTSLYHRSELGIGNGPFPFSHRNLTEVYVRLLQSCQKAMSFLIMILCGIMDHSLYYREGRGRAT